MHKPPPAPDELPIGGFLGIDLPPGHAGSLRRQWRLGGVERAFTNARSALKALLDAIPGGVVWLPAYLCPEFGSVVPVPRRRFYPLDHAFSPDAAFLEHAVAANDIVLGVDYFGRPPQAAFLDYVAARPGAWFIEDCAQALDTGRAPWGDWQLYSPRKLVGVPDGGILVACSGRAAGVSTAASVGGPFADAVELARSHWSRFEDAGEASNTAWYALHQAKERGLGVSSRRISRLTWELLDVLDAASIGAARRRNFAVLAAALSAHAALDELSPSFAPLGFPVRVPIGLRDQVRTLLHRDRLFPAVHWETLLAPPEFAREHAWAATLLTLPCDHRYSAAQMDRLATLFLGALRVAA